MFAKIFVSSLCGFCMAVGFLIGGVHAKQSDCRSSARAAGVSSVSAAPVE
jgi:hypothetical protein